MDEIQLTLYVMGRSSRSETAIVNLRRICEQRLGDDRCLVEIIDVLEFPDRAEREQIMATPTLIRRRPSPARRIIGDLTDMDRVVWALGLETHEIAIETDEREGK
ncbi:MAG: circadian clock KaiB family protein [Anaerolineae bacterium]